MLLQQEGLGILSSLDRDPAPAFDLSLLFPAAVGAFWQGGQCHRTCLCLQVDADIALRYQKVMAEWKACEVIVKQREKESHSATLAKFSSGSSIDSHVQRLIHRDSTISNDVGIPLTLTICSGQCSAFAECSQVHPWEAEMELSTAPESWAETGAVVSPCQSEEHL